MSQNITANCVVFLKILGHCNVNVARLLHKLKRYDLCNSSFWLDMSGCAENVTLGFFSNTNKCDAKLGMLVQLIKLYLFIPLSVTLTIFQCHSSVKQF